MQIKLYVEKYLENQRSQ